MDAFGDDFKVAPKGKRKSYEIEYESLSQSAVENLIREDIEHISGIFGVDVSCDNYFNGSWILPGYNRRASQVCC
jgi:ariadne-1